MIRIYIYHTVNRTVKKTKDSGRVSGTERFPEVSRCHGGFRRVEVDETDKDFRLVGSH